MPEITVSVIVPARNEERNLPRSLGSLQDDSILEIIVADGASSDRTREVAESLGARVVSQTGERMTIGQGRNQAAALAEGELLAFFDADIELPNAKDFFEHVRGHFQDRRVVATVPRLEVFPEEEVWFDRVFHRFFNFAVSRSFRLGQPMSGGQCQVIRAGAFRAAGGYPEHMAHAEDSALLQSIATFGEVRFLHDHVVYHSPRRFRTWGYLKTLAISLKSLLAKQFLKREILDQWERVGE